MSEMVLAEKAVREAPVVVMTPEQTFNQGVQMSKLLMRALENSPEAVIEIQGKKYMKIQGWQVLGAFLGLTTEIVKTERLENGWMAEAELRDKLGERVAKGYGICTRDEKGWKDKPEFALLAMAQTRAIGRALKLYSGWIVALAGIADTPYEEVMGVIEEKREDFRPATEAQVKLLKDLCQKHGVEEPDYSKLSSKQASELIDGLLKKAKEQARQKATSNKKRSDNGQRQALIKSLHAWAGLAGLDEEDYKAYLKETFGKDSSKDMTDEELKRAIRDMRQVWYETMSPSLVEGVDPLQISYQKAKELTDVQEVSEAHKEA